MAKPLLFITGFLGAGKTTLLRSLLRALDDRGRSADVILNDFENAEIDASTLPECAASVFPIAAGCACCESLEDLVKLCHSARKSRGDILLIELNGTVDPLPILETFTILDEELSFHPRLQLGVVDARHWGQRDEFTLLERRQFETATHWFPAHTENLEDQDIEELECAVAAVNPHALRVNSEQLAQELISAVGEMPGRKDRTPESASAAPSDAIRDREHELSHRFTGYQIPLPGRFRSGQMVRFLEALPPEVVRAKALVKLQEAPGQRWLFERVGSHPIEDPQPVNRLTKSPASLVCIGPSLSPEVLNELVKVHFGL